ncbi:hypothetical protein L7F22_055376 [Adiantum nelumboides]|nr:hypothetical protein [Adiantum nelumboides]
MSSSSSSRKRTEHIERTRYPNPLPLPPYPPKQLAINTPPSRYVDPRSFGQRLAASVPLPMVVDAEAGMPLDMTSFPACWYTDQELADADAQGRGGVFPILDRSQVQIDEEDAFLLSDLMSTSTTINGATAADGLDGTATPERGQPTWLKRTEYLAAAEKKARRSELASRHANVENIDASREAQLARIKVTFEAANQPLETLRHPTKGHLRAVDAFPLLPDTDTWATRVDVFRFGDAPGRHIDNRPAHDPRLQTAILRPHQDTLGQPLYSLFAIDAPEAEDIVGQEDEDMFGSGDEAEDDDDDNDDEDRPKKAKAPKTRRAFRSREEQLAAEDAESRRAVDARIRGMETDAESRMSRQKYSRLPTARR